MKKSKLAACCAVIFVTTIFFSCTKTVGVEPKAPVSFCDTISYSKHIVPLITRNCVTSGCHDAATKAGGVEYVSMLKEKADAGRIRARVLDGNPSYMPADKGKLPDAELNVIRCWLDAGAPMN